MKYNVISIGGINLVSQQTAVLEVTVRSTELNEILECFKLSEKTELCFSATKEQVREKLKAKMKREIEEIQNRINELEQPK